MFTNDGSQATVLTSREVLVLILNKTEPELYLKYSKVPYLDGKVVRSLERGTSQIFYVEVNENEGNIQFYSNAHEQSSNFSNTKIESQGHINVREAIEFERNGEKVFRVTGIRDSESLMSWEIIKNSQGDKYFRQINSNRLSTFRWPFYAYAMS